MLDSCFVISNLLKIFQSYTFCTVFRQVKALRFYFFLALIRINPQFIDTGHYINDVNSDRVITMT
jgi:hypothetical protein